MTADVNWPRLTFIPRTPEVRLAGETVSGGRSLTGKLQAVAADSGFWRITLGNIPIRTKDEVLAWEEIAAILEGRLGTVNAHIYQSKRSPWPAGVPGAAIVAKASGALAIGATSGSIDMTTGAAPEPGMYCSAGERLIQLRTVGAPTGSIYPVTFRPPLRDAIANNDPLEFAHPICRCRLASDDGMSLPLDLQRFAVKTVDLEEDI